VNYNKAILLGNVGKDPEIRTTQGGTKVANFSLATNESWKDDNGNWQQSTEWHRIVVFGPLVDMVANRIRSGSIVHVDGKIKYRKWTDRRTNQERITTEIHVTQFKGELKVLDKSTESNHQQNLLPEPSDFDEQYG